MIPLWQKITPRPSHKELNNKILQAENAVSQGSSSILDPIVIAADALNLGYLIEDINKILLEILSELQPNYYVGSYPPQRSYEAEIKGSELFDFVGLVEDLVVIHISNSRLNKNIYG